MRQQCIGCVAVYSRGCSLDLPGSNSLGDRTQRFLGFSPEAVSFGSDLSELFLKPFAAGDVGERGHHSIGSALLLSEQRLRVDREPGQGVVRLVDAHDHVATGIARAQRDDRGELVAGKGVPSSRMACQRGSGADRPMI